MSEKNNKITYAFFSAANDEAWDGLGTLTLKDATGLSHSVNYLGRKSVVRGFQVPGGAAGSPPNPESYILVGTLKNGVLTPAAVPG